MVISPFGAVSNMRCNLALFMLQIAGLGIDPVLQPGLLPIRHRCDEDQKGACHQVMPDSAFWISEMPEMPLPSLLRPQYRNRRGAIQRQAPTTFTPR